MKRHSRLPTVDRALHAGVERDPTIEHVATWIMPVQVVNFANQRMHWGARARLSKSLRTLARSYALVQTDAAQRTLPATVTLTRLYPAFKVTGKRKTPVCAMDSDGCASALKPARDGIADAWGVDDKDGLWTWQYGQRVAGDYGVEVRIERVLR